jgi:hypothetical protein
MGDSVPVIPINKLAGQLITPEEILSAMKEAV